MCLFSDTTKSFEPKPVSSNPVLVLTTHSNRAESTVETDISIGQTHDSSSPGLDDTISDSGTSPTSDGTTNIADEAKCNTGSEEHWNKKDPGIVVDRDRPDKQKSCTDDTGKKDRPDKQKSCTDDTGKEDRPDKQKSCTDDTGKDDRPDKQKSCTDDTRKEEHPEFSDVSSEAKPDHHVEATKTAVDVEEEPFVVGDKVTIKVTENILIELQENYGGCTESMAKVTM